MIDKATDIRRDLTVLVDSYEQAAKDLYNFSNTQRYDRYFHNSLITLQTIDFSSLEHKLQGAELLLDLIDTTELKKSINKVAVTIRKTQRADLEAAVDKTIKALQILDSPRLTRAVAMLSAFLVPKDEQETPYVD